MKVARRDVVSPGGGLQESHLSLSFVFPSNFPQRTLTFCIRLARRECGLPPAATLRLRGGGASAAGGVNVREGGPPHGDGPSESRPNTAVFIQPSETTTIKVEKKKKKRGRRRRENGSKRSGGSQITPAGMKK